MAQVVNMSKKQKRRTLMIDGDNGDKLRIKKSVNITNDCPKANAESQAFLLYTRAQRGHIVQISIYNGADSQGGSGLEVFFPTNCLDDHDVFGATAKRLGITKAKLRSLIHEHLPL